MEIKTFLPYCTLLCFTESGHFNGKDLASRSHSGMSQSFFGYFWLPCIDFKFPYVYSVFYRIVNCRNILSHVFPKDCLKGVAKPLPCNFSL